MSHQIENINKEKLFFKRISKNENLRVKKYNNLNEINSLEGLTSRFNLEEERICKLESRSIKIIQSEEWREKGKKELGKINRAFEKCGIPVSI